MSSSASTAPHLVSFICDAHVHLYPNYPLAETFLAASENLTRLQRTRPVAVSGQHVQKVLCLTERYDCNYFEMLATNPGKIVPRGYEVRPLAEPNALEIILPNAESLLVYAGRQIVTSERLELLALTISTPIPDGQSFADAFRGVQEHGGVPVLNWAPGKWLFSRGQRVAAILENTLPGSLLLGDTSLRPPIWGEPTLMKKGFEAGFGVLAGSDPLPLLNEEQLIGTYGLSGPMLLDLQRPVSSLRTILLKHAQLLERVGQRSSLIAVMQRLYKLRQQKNNSATSLAAGTTQSATDLPTS